MAELEILNVLVGFLCPTNEAASTCNDFISNHSQILPPVGPVFYFLLFPAVFTILFVMILMSSVKVTSGHRGIQIVFGATAFIFIIISGWYPVMLMLSEFWYIIIILLGGFWWFFRGHFGGGEKSPKTGGGMPGVGGGLMEALGERAIKRVTGEEKRLEAKVDLALTSMEKIVEKTHGNPDAWRAYSTEIEQCRNLITQYYNIVMVGGIPIGGHAKEKVERLEQILSKIDKNKS
jgi:hypothetical protein